MQNLLFIFLNCIFFLEGGCISNLEEISVVFDILTSGGSCMKQCGTAAPSYFHATLSITFNMSPFLKFNSFFIPVHSIILLSLMSVAVPQFIGEGSSSRTMRFTVLAVWLLCISSHVRDRGLHTREREYCMNNSADQCSIER